VVELAGLPSLALSATFCDGEALLQAAEHHGLEGVVSKRATSTYASGRCSAWIKSKTPTWRAANRERWRAFVRELDETLPGALVG